MGWTGQHPGAAAIFVLLLAPGSARAQSGERPDPGDDLEAARELFADSLREERESHFAVALEGFRRVLQVRETASVDYHLGLCFEGLGELANAVTAYRAAARLGEGDRKMADVAAASHERIEILSKRVAVLTLTLPGGPLTSVDVRIDGRAAAAPGDVVLDPGHHHVHAAASGAAPFESDLTLPPGGRASVVLPFEPAPPSPPTLGESRPATATRATRDRLSGDAASRTGGWIALGAGGLLLAGSITSLVLRENDIAEANRICPGGRCVGGIDADALRATDRARIEGPLGWTLGAAAVGAVVVGVYVVLQPLRAGLNVSASCGPGQVAVAVRGSL